MARLPMVYAGGGEFQPDLQAFLAAREIGDQLAYTQQRIQYLRRDTRTAGLEIAEAETPLEADALGTAYEATRGALRSERQQRNLLRNQLGQNKKGQPLPGHFDGLSLDTPS